MHHVILEAGVLRLDRLDAVDDLAGRAAEPRLLGDAVAQRRDLRRRPGRAPCPALLVGIAYEAERREPLVAFVVRRLDAADRLLLVARQIEAGAPDHVLAQLLL